MIHDGYHYGQSTTAQDFSSPISASLPSTTDCFSASCNLAEKQSLVEGKLADISELGHRLTGSQQEVAAGWLSSGAPAKSMNDCLNM